MRYDFGALRFSIRIKQKTEQGVLKNIKILLNGLRMNAGFPGHILKIKDITVLMRGQFQKHAKGRDIPG